MNEHDLTDELETWLSDPVPPLDERTLYQTIGRIPTVPQRRRWWPFRWFPFGIGATRSARPSGPQPERRSNSMFTATRVAAGVAILALSGSLALVAGPLTPQPETVPLASSESPSSAEAMGGHTTGTMRLGVGTYGETAPGDAWTEMRGSDWAATWTSDDPRLSGAGSFIVNTNTYLAADGTEFSAGWAELTLENENGSWTSVAPAAGVGMGDLGQSSFWFDGADDYEGLSAFLVQTLAWNSAGAPYYEFEAWIVPGDAHLAQMFE